MNGIMPVLLGYQSVRVDSSSEQTEAGRRAMQEFARREGYELGLIYTDLNGDCRGLQQLLSVVGADDSQAVVVASEQDLGRTVRFRAYVRTAIEQAGGRVLIAGSELAVSRIGSAGSAAAR
jgi:DNA invertase Pin-like site-specific DNA recombinase